MYTNKALAPQLSLSLYVLRCYTDDKTFTTVDVESRDPEKIKQQACALMIADEHIQMVKLAGLALGKPAVEGVIWTRYDAFPWYVDHREREKDAPVVEHFAEKKAALRRYKDYLQQDLIVSSNAVS